ncbi:MAG: VOC family protein [Caulobacteraceae bacterium]|nr:VOC family protein [Caulobacteraceae bacterium]
MLDHISLAIADLARSRAFYDAAFAPLGIGVEMSVSAEESGGAAFVGYGSDGRPYFWLAEASPASGPVHVAFTAADRAGVDAFYAAAIAAGGRDNGGPGLRPHYHPNYYGAFVLDPDGHNIEAVCHAPA